MAKNDNYEISDSLWGRTTQYASAMWESWGQDVDEYVEDVMDTDRRSDEELYASTVLQDSAHSVELVAHLVGSVFSNDYTKERMEELGDVIASTESYQSATETINKLETTLNQATEQFMQEHPKVQTAFMATEDKLEEVTAYVVKEAKEFAKNNTEITNDLKAIIEIGLTIPAAKAVKVASEARDLSKLNTLDYAQPQGNELAKGIPTEIDKKSLNLEELAVTAEAKVGKETLFDTNQQARTEAHPQTPTLGHDEIRAKESKNIAKVERKIERKEKEGDPLTQKEIENEFHKASKPNATLAQSHAETAVIQKAFEQGLTKDADMFIKVNGKEVCGHCNSDTIAMAKESGLKSITIHDYNIDNTQRVIDGKKPLGSVLHWNNETGRKRFDSFETLESEFKNLPKAPDHIKYAGVLETEKASMSNMDFVLLGAGGVVLMNEGIAEEKSLDQEVLEQRVDPQTQETIHQPEVQDMQSSEEPFDSTAKAKEIMDNMFPHLTSPQTQSDSSNNTFYDNGLPDSINEYLSQFESQGYENNMGMERD